MLNEEKSRYAGKTKLTISAILLGLLTLAFIFKNPSGSSENNIIQPVPPSGPGANGFTFGAFNSGWDMLHGNITAPIGFNTWHIYSSEVEGYDGRHYMRGWTHPNLAPGDSLFADYNAYVSQVNTVLSNVPSGMNAYLDRPKLAWLRYGQRSDYQCEAVSPTADLWFYAFNDHSAGGDWQDNSQYGNNQYVRRCLVNQNQTDGGAGWVVKRLRANGEQGLPYGLESTYGDNECQWLIKPRIRIDSTDAHDISNPLVCNIKVMGQDGSKVLLNVDIHSNDFLVDGGGLYYNGRYIEEFPFGPNLTIQGTWSVGDDKGFLFESRGTRSSDDYNKADIQVYWYGSCDMWIDYVRVDNDIANDLFSENPLNTQHQEYMQWLQWEAEIANTSGAAYRYYLELFEFNNIPCMEYVFHKLDSMTNGKMTLVATISPHLFAGHVPWEDRLTVWNIGHFKRNFLDKVGSAEVMLASYALISL